MPERPGLLRRLAGAIRKTWSTAAFSTIFGQTSEVLLEDSDRPTLPLAQISAYAKVVRAITRNVAQVPWTIGEWRKETSPKALRRHWREGFGRGYALNRPGDAAKRRALNEVWEETPDAPIARVFDAPNPFLSRYQLFEAISTWLCHEGVAYIHFIGPQKPSNSIATPGALPLGIEILNPTLIDRWPKDGTPEKWEFRSPSGLLLEFFQVARPCYYNPYDPFAGLSFRQACAMDISTIWDGMRFNRSLMRNGGYVGGMLIAKTGFASQEDKERVRQYFEDRHVGVRKAGRVLPIDGGEMDWKQIDYSNRNMQFFELLKACEDNIRGVYKVPEAEVSQYENTSYASAESGKRGFWEATILPDLRLIEDSFWQTFFRHHEGGKYEGRFDLSQIPALRENVGVKIDNAVKLFSLGYAPNAINDFLSLGLPNLPSGETGYLSMGLVPIGTERPEPPEDEEEEETDEETPPDEEPEDEEEPEEGDEDEDAEGLEEKAVKKVQAGAVGDYWRAYIAKLFAPGEKAIKGKYGSWLMDYRSALLRRLYDAAKKAVPGAETKDPPPSGLTVDDVERILRDHDEWGEQLGRRLARAYERIILQVGEQRAEELGVEAFFHEGDASIENFLARKTIQLKEGPSATITKQVRTTLLEGIQAGEPVRDLAYRLKDTFNGAGSRSLRVARTETLQASGWTQWETDQRSGVVEKKLWVTAQDAEVRTQHMEFQARGYVPLEYLYGDTMKYPGDSNGPASSLCNCRCTYVPQIAGETAEQSFKRLQRATERLKQKRSDR